METKLTFKEWMQKVNAEVIALVGLSAYDLPDVCYHDWYDEEITPKEAAQMAVEYAMED